MDKYKFKFNENDKAKAVINKTDREVEFDDGTSITRELFDQMYIKENNSPPVSMSASQNQGNVIDPNTFLNSSISSIVNNTANNKYNNNKSQGNIPPEVNIVPNNIENEQAILEKYSNVQQPSKDLPIDPDAFLNSNIGGIITDSVNNIDTDNLSDNVNTENSVKKYDASGNEIKNNKPGHFNYSDDIHALTGSKPKVKNVTYTKPKIKSDFGLDKIKRTEKVEFMIPLKDKIPPIELIKMMEENFNGSIIKALSDEIFDTFMANPDKIRSEIHKLVKDTIIGKKPTTRKRNTKKTPPKK